MSKAQGNSGLRVLALPREKKNKPVLPHINFRNTTVSILRSSILKTFVFSR